MIYPNPLQIDHGPKQQGSGKHLVADWTDTAAIYVDL